MIKPDIITRSAYDYRDVIAYIETKYKIKISNIEYPARCKITYKHVYPNITY